MASPLLRGRVCLPHAVRVGVRTLEPDDPNRLREDAVWIQVAREGNYKGHNSGEFTLDKTALEQMVRNVRNHPAYVAGDDGFGIADVIPFDFHHESEKSGGAIAIQGAPAAAWAQDLEIRTGASGALELWALVRYLEPALSYVREGRYKWTSIAAWPDAVEPVTGASIGWYISSIAFTNDPFIQGMAPIAASRAESGTPLMLSDDFDVDETMREIRWIFGLPETAGTAEAIAELAKLEAMVASSDTPPGVDLGELIARVRGLLRLPLLTPATDVLAQLRELIGRLAAATVPASQVQPVETSTLMNYEAIVTALLELARKRGWRVTASDLEEKLELELNSAELAQNVIASLGQMMGIKGSDAQGVLDEISKRSAELEKVKGMLPQLQELLGEQVKAEDDMAEEEVEAAMVAHRMPATAKPALLTHRTGGISLAVDIDPRDPMDGLVQLSEAVAKRRAQREKFQASYPQVPPQQQHLQQSLVTTPGQSPGAVRQLSGGRAPQAAAVVMPPAPLLPEAQSASGGAPWASFPGATEQLKAEAYLAAQQPAFAKLSRQERWQQSCNLVRAHRENLH